MFEIIPNLHPIFVHFTVALLTVAVLLFALAPLAGGTLQRQWRVVARWNLWFGTGFAVITVITGFLAYNSVVHDTAGHAAMVDHRNWAVITVSAYIFLAAWSMIGAYRGRERGPLFILAALLAGALLAGTAWRGGELVFRHGLGVMSLPEIADNPRGASDGAPVAGEAAPGESATRPEAPTEDHGDHSH